MVESSSDSLNFVVSKFRGYVNPDFETGPVGRRMIFYPSARPELWEELKAAIPPHHFESRMKRIPQSKIYDARAL